MYVETETAVGRCRGWGVRGDVGPESGSASGFRGRGERVRGRWGCSQYTNDEHKQCVPGMESISIKTPNVMFL